MERTVLIIDDSEPLRRHVEKVLREHDVAHAFRHASSGVEGFALLAREPVSLVLCDVEMPGLDGFKFLRLKAQKVGLHDVPVIMLTGKEDVRAKVQGLSEGASDYLTKPFHDEELVARARVHLKLKELQDELRRKNGLLEELSRTDSLTGLLNRRFLMDLLLAEFQKSARYGTPLSLIMLDIDHFKRVNDTYGHTTGDSAIQTVAQVLRREIRTCDLAARFGGEEFAVVLPQTDQEGGLIAAERCRRAVEVTAVAGGAGTLHITASFGVATCPRTDLTSVEAFINAADQALYRAKDAGRNRVMCQS
jgi:diguanylate cyclase (GGDEF)-like protein